MSPRSDVSAGEGDVAEFCVVGNLLGDDGVVNDRSECKVPDVNRLSIIISVRKECEVRSAIQSF